MTFSTTTSATASTRSAERVRSTSSRRLIQATTRLLPRSTRRTARAPDFLCQSATGAVALDYFAYDRATGKLWVPASNTGSLDVIDEKTDAVTQVTGFKTGEIERRGRKVTLGPTAASIGDGVVYIGNRGDATLCVIDAKTLACGECVPLSTDHSVTPDGVLYVAAAKEVWITTRP